MKKKKKALGSPPYYTDPQTLENRIVEYFESGKNYRTVIVGSGRHKTSVKLPMPTITGLVLYCGFCNRAAFYDYENKPEFCNTIKKARTRIEQNYEELLQAGLGAGAIFALKNFGWIDKASIEFNDISKEKLEIIPDKVEFPQNRIKEFVN